MLACVFLSKVLPDPTYLFINILHDPCPELRFLELFDPLQGMLLLDAALLLQRPLTFTLLGFRLEADTLGLDGLPASLLFSLVLLSLLQNRQYISIQILHSIEANRMECSPGTIDVNEGLLSVSSTYLYFFSIIPNRQLHNIVWISRPTKGYSM